MENQSLIHQLMTSNKNLLVKKVMTPLVLVSVSLFSFVYSTNSCSLPWWWHSFLHPFIKFYFSSLPMQVLSHALDKTWIFLICNGIVVVIANTSANNTVQYNSPWPPLDAKAVTYHDDPVLEFLPEPSNAVSELLEEKENVIATVEELEEEEEQEGGGEREGEGNREPEIISCITGDDDDGESENEEEEEEEGEYQSETGFMRTEEEEDQEQVYDHDHEYEYEYEEEEEGEGRGGEGMDKLSTEELNKKFEDFIRKTKEEFMIQLVQQNQLILSC